MTFEEYAKSKGLEITDLTPIETYQKLWKEYQIQPQQSN